jgi:hypothetical protein
VTTTPPPRRPPSAPSSARALKKPRVGGDCKYVACPHFCRANYWCLFRQCNTVGTPNVHSMCFSRASRNSPRTSFCRVVGNWCTASLQLFENCNFAIVTGRREKLSLISELITHESSICCPFCVDYPNLSLIRHSSTLETAQHILLVWKTPNILVFQTACQSSPKLGADDLDCARSNAKCEKGCAFEDALEVRVAGQVQARQSFQEVLRCQEGSSK